MSDHRIGDQGGGKQQLCDCLVNICGDEIVLSLDDELLLGIDVMVQFGSLPREVEVCEDEPNYRADKERYG